ncbi:MAG: glycoside hydrolase family 13 protein, partial [Chloroflexota bacterium]|nr:glycoside hydrolase family 13 protein [Chloroflexota bacterium]
RGMRVIIDGVFNHASRGFFQFHDILENGAASPWIDWFTFAEHPVNAYDHNRPPGYTAWAGLHKLPKFNTDNPDTREFLMGVAEYWLRQGTDGWRLDVAAEITSDGFWQEFRQRVKSINPDAYIVGEIWHESQDWLQGDQFDAVMNYRFTEAAIAFAAGHRVVKETVVGRSYAPWPGIDAATYADKIDRLLSIYPWEIQLAMLNLLDGHDTSRFLSIAGGDIPSVQLATLLLFTYPGPPCVYYGDEIGLTGALPDRNVRGSFPWHRPETWNHDLHAYHKRLISFRSAHPALRTGSYDRLFAEHGLYVFVRQSEDETLLIAVNAGDNAQDAEVILDDVAGGFSNDLELLFAINGDPSAECNSHNLRLSLPARSGAIFNSRPS